MRRVNGKVEEKEGMAIYAGSFTIVIESGVLSSLATRIIRCAPSRQYVVITDRNVAKLHVDSLTSSFKSINRKIFVHALPPGVTKTRRTKQEIEDWMASVGCGSDTCLIALGGGLIQDLCGIVAKSFSMGIPLIEIPTTLVGMLGCSIRHNSELKISETAVIGADVDPKAVFIDLDTLKTLPLRRLREGIAFAMRTGIVLDRNLFSIIDENAHALQQHDIKILAKILQLSITARLQVESKEETNGNLIAVKNFGATIGQAVEELMSPMLVPGQCLAIGMMAELELAYQLGHVKSAMVGRVRRCLKKFRLPTSVPVDIEPSDLLETLLPAFETKDEEDVKEIPQSVNVVMITGLGKILEPNPIVEINASQLQQIVFSQQDAVAITPSKIHGKLRVHGSKSFSNRILLLAALGKGVCRIKGLQMSDSTEIMIVALKKLGVHLTWTADMETLIVTGCGGKLKLPESELYLGSASTATRFLTTAANLIQEKGEVAITGDERSIASTIDGLVDALNENGCKIEYMKKKGSLPLKLKVGGGTLKGGEIRLSASLTSQFVSSVMLSAPLAKKEVKLIIENEKPIVSKQYITITKKCMEKFGIEVKSPSPGTFIIPNGGYTNPENLSVEGDATAACYHLAMAAVTGGTVTIENIGSSSTQMEAYFCKLLEKMGCEVKLDENSTTLSGPPPPKHKVGMAGASTQEEGKKVDDEKGERRELCAISGNIDMGDLGDVFMTLASVAAIARGTTTIVNIANQRYKDSNRLEVMIEQLRAAGVICDTFESGIKIQGNPMLRYKASQRTITVLNPHHDSRVAMSFAVLATAIPGLAIAHKASVEATYPAFWKDMQKLNGDIGAVLDKETYEIPRNEASIWLVGMRGVGKSTLGKLVSQSLGKRFLDLDKLFTIKFGIEIRAFVQKYSWRAFRKRELELFKEVVQKHPRNCVVACGAGLIETPEAISILQKLSVVVQINRHIDDVALYLNKDGARPALLRDGKYAWDSKAIWKRRKVLYHAASNYEFPIYKGDTSWIKIQEDLENFLRRITGMHPASTAAVTPEEIEQISKITTIKLVTGTFFLSLTFPNLNQAVPLMSNLVAGNSAIELRVDLWESWDPDFIGQQITLFRRHCCLPIVYTIRTKGQCGKFPNDEKKLFRLYELGIRLGCEYIDMEHHWSRSERNKIMRHRRHSKIIASAHFKNSNGGSEADLENTFQLCAHGGRADVVKVVTTAYCLEDAVRLVHVAKNVRLPGNPPKIILAMGAVGQISRVFNEFLTPVTHALMPGVAAPGQLSIAEIMTARRMLSIRAPMKRGLYLIGRGVSQSLTPLILNTAMEYLHLEHTAKVWETADGKLDQIFKLFESKDFGGAVVSSPFKTEILPLVAQMSQSARMIGAINAVAVLEDGTMFGHNTDWISFHQKLSSYRQRKKRDGRVALVLGSGGSARAAVYALLLNRFSKKCIIVCDPTNPERAKTVSKHFECKEMQMSALKSLRNVSVVISTFRKFGPLTSEILLPLPVIQQCPLVIDTRYLPLHTKLEEQAAVYGCNTLRGLDLLIIQNIETLKLLVGGEHWAMVDSAAPIINRAVRHKFYKTYVEKKQ